MPNSLVRLFYTLIGFCLIFVAPMRAHAFVDNFDSNASLDNYTIDTNSGSVTIANGSMILSSPTGNNRYPYVRLKEDILTDQIFSVEIIFKYEFVGVFGAGIVLDNNYPNNGTSYDVGSNSILWTWNWGIPPTMKLGRYPFNHSIISGQNDYHTLRISGTSGNYSVYLDGLFQGFTGSTKEIKAIWFGNPEIVGSVSSWPTIHISQIIINDSLETDTFPYLSQSDPLWKDVIYDSATEWAGDNLDTIERWGCAITSTAMILQNYDIKTPDGQVVTPPLLNQWLVSQPDGYVGNGLLNWLAVSRMTHLSRLAGHADTDLEFVKSTGSATEEIADGYYPIINEQGHFVVAYSQSDTNYLINDPNDENRTEIPKNTTIVSVNTYIPSNTDLSYLLFELPTNTTVDIDLGGGDINPAIFEESLIDDVGGGNSPTAKLVYISKPASGNYHLDIDNPGDSQDIKIFAYSPTGEVYPHTLTVPPGESKWSLSYDPDNIAETSTSELDSEPPIYTGTNTFSGWYNSAQTATFTFADPNLADGYVMPTCIISGEGKDKKCTVTTTVCDTFNNCQTHTLTSNPANIDLTRPQPPKRLWAIGLQPFSLLHWQPTHDTVKYRVVWGETNSNLNMSLETTRPGSWIKTPHNRVVYYRVYSIDRAGNMSDPSNVERVSVIKHGFFHWFW